MYVQLALPTECCRVEHDDRSDTITFSCVELLTYAKAVISQRVEFLAAVSCSSHYTFPLLLQPSLAHKVPSTVLLVGILLSSCLCCCLSPGRSGACATTTDSFCRRYACHMVTMRSLHIGERNTRNHQHVLIKTYTTTAARLRIRSGADQDAFNYSTYNILNLYTWTGRAGQLLSE